MPDSDYKKALFAPVKWQETPAVKASIDYMLPFFNKAIKTAEGNPRNFGVLKAKTPTQAEKMLNQSIRNDIKRWLQAGKPNKFIDFMRDRWAPLNAENDPEGLNYNFAPNVRKSLLKQLGEKEYNRWKQYDIVMNILRDRFYA